MLVDATSLILQDGMSAKLGFDTPLGLIITSSIISVCIWASSVLILQTECIDSCMMISWTSMRHPRSMAMPVLR